MNFESMMSFVLNGLWRASWQASVLAIIVLVVQKLLGRRLGGRGRFALWAIVVVRLLLPVLPQSRWSVFNLVNTRQSAPTVVAQPVENSVLQNQGAIPIIVLQTPRAAKPQADQPAVSPVAITSQTQSIRWSVWIFSAWIAGVLTLGIRVAHVCWGLSRTIRKLSAVTDEHLLRMLESCASILHVNRIPQIVHGPDVQTPAVVGLFRPKLLLPSHVLSACDDREIRLILLHELAHLKRHDIAGNWLIALASVLHWFNPVVWLLSARMRADRELACDELVLSTSSGEAQAYGKTLLKLIEILSPNMKAFGTSPRQLAIVGILEPTTPMQRRVRMIAQFNPKQSRRWIWTVVVLGTLATIALTDAVRGANEKHDATSQPATHPSAHVDVVDGSQNQAAIEAALAKVLPEVNFDNAALGDAMDFLREQSGANLVVNWRILEEVGINRDTQISVRLKKITVAQALDHILNDAGGGTVKLGHAIVDGAIVVSTDVDLANNTKTVAYDVSDLIQPGPNEDRQKAVDHLTKVVMDIVMPDTWKANGGVIGTMQELNGKLIVQNTPEAQQKVAELLALLRSQQAPPVSGGTLAFNVSPGQIGAGAFGPTVQQPQPSMPHTVVSDEQIETANRAAIALLHKKIPEVKFDGIAVSDVIDFLRDVTGGNINANWKALEQIGVDKSAAVSLRLKDVTLETVLNSVTHQLSAQQQVAIVIDQGVITLTTLYDLPSYNVTKTYDVSDLLQQAGAPATPGAPGAPPQQDLVSVVQNVIQLGGSSVQVYGGKLIVTALPNAQEQVEKLLANLRGKSTTQPTDRARAE